MLAGPAGWAPAAEDAASGERAAAVTGEGEAAGVDPRDAEIARLREDMEAMRQRIDALEAALAARDAADAARAEARAEAVAAPVVGYADGEVSSPLEQKSEAEAPAAPESTLDITGALRFTGFWSSASDSNEDTRGEAGLDIFRIGAEGTYKDIVLSAEYRFYPFMEVIHHGWIGYRPDDTHMFEAGITKVPFGLLPYASHNFWFGVPYYIGLSDDYDIGAKYRLDRGSWDLQLAFFKNEELGDPSNLERYSFDVVTAGPEQNEQTNQFNARVAHTFGEGTDFITEAGVSGMWGQLYNNTTRENGDFWAVAGHIDSRYKRWNLQLELGHYRYNPENPPGLGRNTVRLGAFATSYDIAAEGTFGVANIAYNFPVPVDFLDSILGYNDFSVLLKNGDAFDPSYLNTTGVALGSGPIFIYLDFIQARNMVFFDDGSLAAGGNEDWEVRVNLNVGSYW